MSLDVHALRAETLSLMKSVLQDYCTFRDKKNSFVFV